MKLEVKVASTDQREKGVWVDETPLVCNGSVREAVRAHTFELFQKYHEMWDTDELFLRFYYSGVTVCECHKKENKLDSQFYPLLSVSIDFTGTGDLLFAIGCEPDSDMDSVTEEQRENLQRITEMLKSYIAKL